MCQALQQQEGLVHRGNQAASLYAPQVGSLVEGQWKVSWIQRVPQVWNQVSGMRVGYDASASLEYSTQNWTLMTRLDRQDKIGPM